MQRRAAPPRALLERALQLARLLDALRRDAEALGQSNEVGVLQARADRPAAELRFLIAQHVGKRMVVEDDRNERDSVLRRRRELLHAEHESAVTR